MSYAKSAETRQAILDHLHANPLQGAKAIADEIGINRNSVESCVRTMTARGELEKVGKAQATKYKAIAIKTVSAEEIVAEMQEKRHLAGMIAEKSQVAHGKVSSPGFYSQKGGGWKAQAAQGGQGATRRVVSIAAVML